MVAEQKELTSWFCADCDSPLTGSHYRKQDGRIICQRCEDKIQAKKREAAQPDLFVAQDRLFNPQRRRNVQGFRDHNGVFHPIRADRDNYNEFLAGDFDSGKHKARREAKQREKKQDEYRQEAEFYKDEIKELREAELGKKSLSQFVRSMGGMVPGGMYAGEIKRLGYKETGTTGLINTKARQGSHKQTAEYVMDAANVEGYRDKHGERFTSIGDFLLAVEDDVAKHSTGFKTYRRKGVKKARDARKMAKAMVNPIVFVVEAQRPGQAWSPVTSIDRKTGRWVPSVFKSRASAERIARKIVKQDRKYETRIIELLKNPGIVDIAAGLQAADYLTSRLTSKRKRRNPKARKPKYKIGDLVYSYQNKDYRAPINFIHDNTVEDGHDYGFSYRLSLKEPGDIYFHNSNWINENSLSKRRKSNPAPAPARFPATKTPAKVVKFERIQDVDTKEKGTILGRVNGWIKVKWDNRAKSTLISPDQIQMINGELCCMPNPHKSYYRLATDTSRARTKVFKAARAKYLEANKLYAQGKTKEATALYKAANNLLERGVKSGKYADGPVGTLPNPLSQHVQLLTQSEQAKKKRFKRGVNLPYICEECGMHFKENDLIYFWPIVHIAVHRKHTNRKENPVFEKRVYAVSGDQKDNPYHVTLGQVEAWNLSEAKAKAQTIKAEFNRHTHAGRITRVYVVETSQVVAKVRTPTRQNPTSVRAMSERFQGTASGSVQDLKAANGAPANMSRAGRLVFLKLVDTHKTIKIPGAVVCIDPKSEKLWIAGNRQPLLSHKAKKGERLDFGPIEQICYQTAKKHIGSGKVFEYVHTFGEEGGSLPHLLVDDEGMPILRGGSYKITAAGIVN